MDLQPGDRQSLLHQRAGMKWLTGCTRRAVTPWLLPW